MTTTKRTTTKRKSTTTRKPAAKKSSTPKVVLTPSSRVDEILSAVVAERTKAKKIEILQQYNENFIKSVFIWNFDETVKSDLPPGEVLLLHRKIVNSPLLVFVKSGINFITL